MMKFVLILFLLLKLETSLAQNQTIFHITDTKNITDTLRNSLNATLNTLKSVESLYQQTADNLINTNQIQIQQRLDKYKTQLSDFGSTTISSALSLCLDQGNFLNVIGDLVVQRLNNCALVILTEVVNIISNSINEAQAFMSLSTMMASNIENCGLGPECLPKIVNDAFYESLATPSKVLVLAARVQQFAFHSVGTVTGCILEGVENVVDMGTGMMDGVVRCVEREVYGSVVV